MVPRFNRVLLELIANIVGTWFSEVAEVGTATSPVRTSRFSTRQFAVGCADG